MKNLYHRIVATTLLVMVLSSTFAFFAANLYYQYRLKSFNDSKVTQMAESMKQFYEQNGDVELASYLKHTGELGYQFYVVDELGQGEFYGPKFRKESLEPEVIQQVFTGKVYHGIAEFPAGLFVTGFFDNDLRNTIGVSLQKSGEPAYAVFIRPNAIVQFGEMRTFLLMIMLFSFILSILLVAFSTRYMVRPIEKLTEATKMLARGNYKIKLDVKRDDEIGKLAVNFSQMATSLEQLEAMRQEFVSNVSHEIQSPLASIQGFSHTLLTADLPEEQRRHYLSIIEDESRRISQLSKQLLTLASLEKEEALVEKNPFDVGEQIRQVLFMTEWSWRDKELAIKMELPSLYIHADSKLLHQVWINLITNSIKFTEEGGTISVRLRPDGKGQLIVEVADTGIGIAEEDLPFVFQRFYRADKSRNRKEGSSGLGLAIVSKIVEMHGGDIEVESELGNGTVFRVKLPIE